MSRRVTPAAAVLTLAALLLGGCRGCKTDAEKAEDERADIRRRLERSLTLTPYRTAKLAIRASGHPNEPEALKQLAALLDTASVTSSVTSSDLVRRTKEMARLTQAFVLARKSLAERDEDEFPLLYTLWTKEPAPLALGYDAALEHLFVSIFLIGLDVLSGGGDKLHLRDPAFYELSRAEPGALWAPPFVWLARLARGLSFTSTGYHYAAEEELDAYLAALAELEPSGLAAPVKTHATDQQLFLLLRALGHLGRAWNRHGLGRVEGSNQDLERGLEDLEAAGIENELTDWLWVVLHTRQGDYAAASLRMEKLAAMPELEPKTRAAFQDVAEELRSTKKLPVYAETKAGVLVAHALVQRGGGYEKLLALFVGPERARRIVEPIERLGGWWAALKVL